MTLLVNRLPDEHGLFTVVQMYIGDSPVLAIANNTRTHGEVLEEVLRSNNLRYESVNLNGDNVPATSGNGYRVVGMGALEIDITGHKFGGKSCSYKLEIDEGHLKQSV